MSTSSPSSQDQLKAVTSQQGEQNILTKIQNAAPHGEQQELQHLAHESIAALRRGDGQAAEQTTQQFLQRVQSSSSTATVLRPNLWSQGLLSCGNSCEPLLMGGDAEGYGVCYWYCVLTSW